MITSEVSQAGLIGRRRDGNTRRLTTTRRFSEMFGCPHTDRKKVKAWFREMVTTSGMLDGMESKLALRDETDEEGGFRPLWILEKMSNHPFRMLSSVSLTNC